MEVLRFIWVWWQQVMLLMYMQCLLYCVHGGHQKVIAIGEMLMSEVDHQQKIMGKSWGYDNRISGCQLNQWVQMTIQEWQWDGKSVHKRLQTVREVASCVVSVGVEGIVAGDDGLDD